MKNEITALLRGKFGTLKKALEVLDIKPSTYYAYMNGRRKITLDFLVSVRNELGMSNDVFCKLYFEQVSRYADSKRSVDYDPNRVIETKPQ